MTSLLLACALAAAAEPASVWLGAEQGLPVDRVYEVGFASDDALWATTPIGLYRFDGRRFHRADDGAPRQWSQVATGPEGEVAFVDRAGVTAEWVDGAVQPLDVPLDTWVGDVAFGQDGALWLQQGGRIFRRQGQVFDEPVASALVEGEYATTVTPTEHGVLVGSTKGVLAWTPDGVERLASMEAPHGVVSVVFDDDGALLTLQWTGQLDRWVQGRATRLLAPDNRGVSLTRRGEVVWATWDHRTARITDGDHVEHWRSTSGQASRVSPDGALVAGGLGGVVIQPEPDTRRFGTDEGLPGPAVRFLDQRPGGALWVSTWSGGARLDEHLESLLKPPRLGGSLCPDDSDMAWSVGADENGTPALFRIAKDQPEVVVRDWGHGVCTTGTDAAWVGRGTELWRMSGGVAERVGELPPGTQLSRQDDPGHVWSIGAQQLCEAQIIGTTVGAWTCYGHDLSFSVLTGVARVDGFVLFATDGLGLLRLRDGVVEPHPHSDAVLGSRALLGLTSSPRGGVWVSGHGVVLRVEPASLEVLERLGPWIGVSGRSAGQVLEQDDGDLWVATAAGLVHIPARARTVPSHPPEVSFTAVRIQGEPVTGALQVPPGPHRVELDIAAMAYRDRAGVQYRVEVDGERVQSEGQQLVLVDLPAGEHTVRVAASRDGVRWSEPATVTLEVARPWWRSPWLYLALVLSVLGLGAAVQRARTALLVARERERTDIAMDLHDQLGSGLGSIRLLADALARESLAPQHRAVLSQRVMATAGELHEGVQEIVGVLRRGGTTVEALMGRLEVRAVDLFGARADVTWPREADAVDLGVVRRRELERIGVEALHNVARHAHASRVVVRLEVRPWRLDIADDGVGISGEKGEGLGMTSMRRRAERIGATLEVQTAERTGTLIRVRWEES